MSKRQWMFFVGALLLIQSRSIVAKREIMITLFDAFEANRPLSPEFKSLEAAREWALGYMNNLIPDPNMSPREARAAALQARNEAREQARNQSPTTPA